MTDYPQQLTWLQAVLLAGVVLAHATVLYGLVHSPVRPAPAASRTIYGYLIEAPPVPVAAARPAPAVTRPRPRVRKPARHRHLIAARAAPQAPAAPAPPAPPAQPAPGPAVAAATVTPAPPAQPLTLGDELAVSCPERVPPDYPALSLRLREEGHVVLRVELDEQGRVHHAQVQASSGSARLDRAALAAVRRWRCNPARRAGRRVPAVAMQPFDFVIEER